MNTTGGDDAKAQQVHDHATEKLSGEQVANAAAETLHGQRAAEEVYEQPDAHLLPGGSTLIADEPAEASGTTAGTRRDEAKDTRPSKGTSQS